MEPLVYEHKCTTEGRNGLYGENIGMTHGRSLHVANLDGDEDLEICAPGLSKESAPENLYRAYLLIWDKASSGSYQMAFAYIPGYESPRNFSPSQRMAVGELDSRRPGEEITLTIEQQDGAAYELFIYNYFFQIGYMPVSDLAYVTGIGNVYGDTANEIIVGGKAIGVTNFYLEVYNSSLATLWKRIGKSPKEGSVFDAAIIEK